MIPICIDFDGVLNDYNGWAGEDELYNPRKGAKEFLEKLATDYYIVILTARNNNDVESWLKKYGFVFNEVTSIKPPALVYIDDRALKFNGDYDKIIDKLSNFKTHWQNDTMTIDKNITDNMNSWEFNEEVTKCFENMLERSIPSYETMRHLVDVILINHIKSNQLMHTNILDLGSSEGKSIHQATNHLKSNYFLGLECSIPMLQSARKHYRNYNNVDFTNIDLREINELPLKQCGGILSILTLQFIPIEYRQKIVRMVYDSLHKNGIFIFVEKVLGDTYQTNDLYETLYYDTKKLNGYSYEEIRDKKLKLEGVLVPVTNNYNISLLKQAGFKNIDIFWKHLNFVGYIAYK